jgi:hypothetical protein
MACVENKGERNRSREIDREIKRERRNNEQRINMTIFGTEDSNIRQFMCRIKSPEQIDYLRYKNPIKQMVLVSMQLILQNESYKIPKRLRDHRKVVLEVPADGNQLVRCGRDIEILWKHKSIKNAWKDREVLGIQVKDHVDYFLDNIERISDENYIPSETDFIHFDAGIWKIQFEYNTIRHFIIDTTRQKSESRKWLHCFDDVTAAVFLVSLEHYETGFTESLKLWISLTSTTYLQYLASWILIFDVPESFTERIKTEPLSTYFPDLPPEKGSDFTECCNYISILFQNSFGGSRFYPNFIDRNNSVDDIRKTIHKQIRDSIIAGAINEWEKNSILMKLLN